MKDTFWLKIIYRSAVSLYNITNTVESVQGAKIRHLNFNSAGRDFVGIIVFDASQLIDFENIMFRIRQNRDIVKVEQIERCW